jgi:hypothetical protein
MNSLELWDTPSKDYDLSSPPILGLRKLNRSPKEIIAAKKSKASLASLSSDEMKKSKSSLLNSHSSDEVGENGDKEPVSWIEGEIQWKLYYLGLIREAAKSRKDSMKMVDSLLKLEKLESRLTAERLKIERLNRQRKEFEAQLLLARQDIECVETLMIDNEKSALQSLVECQNMLMNQIKSEEETTPLTHSRVFHHPFTPFPRRKSDPGLGNSSDYYKSPKALSPIIPLPDVTRPPPASAGRTSCPQFTDLFSLAGQLAEFCHGEHGSNFVVKRILMGTQPERRVVVMELALPRSLVTCLSNVHCRKVVQALMETDKVYRKELMSEANRSSVEVLKLDLDKDLFQLLFPLYKGFLY